LGKAFVKPLRPIAVLAAAASALVIASSADAQRQPPTPEQRIDRLEKQVQQMQRQVFPRGRPADTAGFSSEPAATQSSVTTLDQRLDALERQMSDLLRQSEENGHRLQTLEGDLGKLRTDQEQRISTLEQRINEAASAAPENTSAEPTEPSAPPPVNKPKPKAPATAATPPAEGTAGVLAGDPGEDAYTEGFHLWQSGQYDAAITSLRAFTSAYPKHRRASYANNLIGRALLDKGEARAAAQALLANYRDNPNGERAPDSLYYLGQALMKLGQPDRACNVYGEFEAVFGSKARADLRKLVADGKAEAKCT
jgi:TolA-binding protein